MPKPVLGPRRTTHPLIWCAAIICTALAVAVIATGAVVFVGYIVLRPRVPSVSVAGARLDRLSYDRSGLLSVGLAVLLRFQNDNAKARALFYATAFSVRYQGIEIARLVASPFGVPRNSSAVLDYEVQSSAIPLSPVDMEHVDSAIKTDRIVFQIKGQTRTKWRVGVVGSVKFWCFLGCDLAFHPSNRTYIPSKHCTSKSKSASVYGSSSSVPRS